MEERKSVPTPIVSAREGESELTQDGTILGTPAYLSPEQALGQIDAIDQRSDIYALGGILYALLTLQPPMEKSDDNLSLLMRVAEGAIKPPTERAPERAALIPPELSAIALKALAKDPAKRYQTVEAFQRDLELYQEGRSVSAKQDTKWELAVKFVKRNKAFSAAALIGGVLLLAVLTGSSVVNYRAAVRADEARERAEKTYEDLVNEQKAKQEQARKSAPAFLKAARLTASEPKQFGDALTQVSAALDFDPALTDGYLLKGQLLLSLQRYGEAVEPLREYSKRKPGNALARQLVASAERPEPTKAAYFVSLSDVFQKQKASALADHMTRLAERLIEPKRDKLALYQKRIDIAWPGLGPRLQLVNDEYHLGGLGGNQPVVSDLTRLKGIPLSALDLRGTKVESLEPLRGMSLVWLNISGCISIHDLGPLKGMPLKLLEMEWLGEVTSLEPLRGMPLERLGLRACGNITSLEPLRNMPLTHLELPDCAKVVDLRPLKGMKLKTLAIWHLWGVKDISPLQGQPLEVLSLTGLREIYNFEPLRSTKKLTTLDLAECSIQDLRVLQGLPLTSLNLRLCQRVKILDPLHGMQLTNLNLDGNREVRDIAPLKGLPLKYLVLAGTQVSDLTPLKDVPLNHLALQGTPLRDLQPLKGLPLTHLWLDGAPVRNLEPLHDLKLQTLGLLGCLEIRDLHPLEGMELNEISLSPAGFPKGSLDVLRRMPSLEFVTVDGGRRFETAEFWKLYDAGRFNK
jgi:Leucine-rich repeat (LRR) protein